MFLIAVQFIFLYIAHKNAMKFSFLLWKSFACHGLLMYFGCASIAIQYHCISTNSKQLMQTAIESNKSLSNVFVHLYRGDTNREMYIEATQHIFHCLVVGN